MARDGARALTMRALAKEAGCALGLPYKIFDSREALLAELVQLELVHLSRQMRQWAGTAGKSTVAANLKRFATILLDAQAPILVHAGELDAALLERALTEGAATSGLTGSFESVVADYLRAEQRQGRVRGDVDPKAYGFLVTGAVHNLLVAGPGYPRPSRPQLMRMISAVATSISTHA
jgi:AcrR family transcriptional regulator